MSMAKAQGKKKKQSPTKRRVSFMYIHKLAAGTSLLAFFVILLAGLMAEVPLTTLLFRTCVVVLVISVISRILIRVLASYEEINSSQI
jgi:phosphatidylglycerophosphate synthase